MANPVLINGVGSPQSIYEVSTTKYHRFGTAGYLGDRVFYYGCNTTSSALAIALLMGQAANVAAHQNVTIAGTAGNKYVTLAIGAGAIVAEQYADGWLLQDKGTGQGQARRIVSHGVSAGSTTVTFYIDYPWTTTSASTPTGGVQKNLFADPAVYLGVYAQTVVGVLNVALPAGDATPQYGWYQRRGPCPLSCEGSVTIGQSLSVGTGATTDIGQGMATVDATISGIVGHVIIPNGTDEEYALVNLEL